MLSMKVKQASLTTGLSSPRSESRSASAMAYAGTGSRFFTRILAVFQHELTTIRHGGCSHGHTRAVIQRYAAGFVRSEPTGRAIRASGWIAACGVPGRGRCRPSPPRPRLRASRVTANQTGRYQTDICAITPPAALALFLFEL